jgi:hypothetical protein
MKLSSRGVTCESLRLSACLLLLSACVAKPVQVTIPDEVTGTVSDPEYSGWNLDLCNEGQVTRSLPECAPLGPGVYEMEIYRVTLTEVRALNGQPLSPRLVVGFISHALRDNYHERKCLRLRKAPSNFRESAGIEYLAWAGEC